MVKSAHLLLLLFVCCIYGNVTSTFTDRMIRATEFITKAKQNLSTDDDYINICPKDCMKCLKDCPECPSQKPFDCADVLNAGHIKSGVYEIWLMNRVIKVNPLRVYCDMDTDGGGWTVIQRRGDFGSPKDFFFRDRKSYKEGFGEVEKDFWLGNERIFALTNQKRYSVRFDLMDVEKNRRYAHYDQFWIIDPLMGYYLRIYNYSGNAGDAMEYHNNQIFTTKGARTSIYNCAAERKGGWWYTNQFIVRRWGCNLSNLNGIYHKGKYDGNATNFDGVTWVPWKGPNESLFWTEIKVRPKDFKAPLNV